MRNLFGEELESFAVVGQISFSVELPTLLDVAGRDLLRLKCFDQVSGLDPDMQNLWRCNLFDPVSLINDTTYSSIDANAPDMCATRIDSVTADDCSFCWQPEQCVVD